MRIFFRLCWLHYATNTDETNATCICFGCLLWIVRYRLSHVISVKSCESVDVNRLIDTGRR